MVWAIVAAPCRRMVGKAETCCHDFDRWVLMSVSLRCARLLILQFQALVHLGESAAGPRLRFLPYPQLLAVLTFDVEAEEEEDDAERNVEVLLPPPPRAPGPPQLLAVLAFDAETEEDAEVLLPHRAPGLPLHSDAAPTLVLAATSLERQC